MMDSSPTITLIQSSSTRMIEEEEGRERIFTPVDRYDQLYRDWKVGTVILVHDPERKIEEFKTDYNWLSRFVVDDYNKLMRSEPESDPIFIYGHIGEINLAIDLTPLMKLELTQVLIFQSSHDAMYDYRLFEKELKSTRDRIYDERSKK